MSKTMHFTHDGKDVAIAACFIDLGGNAPAEIQLTPDGLFNAKDGRPNGLPGWRIDAGTAPAILANFNATADKRVIDWDHATLNTQKTGQKAPAAGWFDCIEYRPGRGLFALNVEWTAEAKTDIANKKYRYVSPVIAFDKRSGAVTNVLMAALVNFPAIDGMQELAANIAACKALAAYGGDAIAACAMQEWNGSAALRAEFGGLAEYVAYRRADSAGLVRIHRSSVIR